MSDSYDSDSRTEQPTARRLEKAREEGRVLRAHGVAAGAVLVAGAAALSLAGARFVELLELSLRRGLTIDLDKAREPDSLLAAAAGAAMPGVEIAVPFLILMAVVGLAADIMVGGWVFSARPLTADFSLVNPVRGFGRLWSRGLVVESLKALLKLAVVGAISFWLLRRWAPALLGTAAESWPHAADGAALVSSRLFIVLSAALLGTAALEVPYQVWAHRNHLKMTRQDVREELRELDGSPQTKRRIKLLRRRFARMRMATEVPKADVVLINPEHYAAALQYREGKMRAPRLVAKGTDLVALRIREIAAEHGVPVVEAPPLARAICRFVELEEEIPAALYPPVAEILAYVYRLHSARAARRPAPPMPQDGRFEPPPEFTA